MISQTKNKSPANILQDRICETQWCCHMELCFEEQNVIATMHQ